MSSTPQSGPDKLSQNPNGPNQQKENILEKGWFLPFNLMANKLTDPRHDKNPKPMTPIKTAPEKMNQNQHRNQLKKDQHINGRISKLKIIDQAENHQNIGPVHRTRDQAQKSQKTEHDQRNADFMNDLISGLLVGFTIFI